MAATIIENTGTEPFVLPAPLRGIIAPQRRIYLNLSMAQVAMALGGTSGYCPPDGAMLCIRLVYDAAYSGAYDSYYEGQAGGANNVAIRAGRVPYGDARGTALTSEATFSYNPTIGVLSVGTLSTSVDGNFGNTVYATNANISTNFGMGGATPAPQGAAIPDAAGGATVDAEARTALNALLAQLRTFGFIAP